MGLKDYILHSCPVARLSGSEFTKQEGFTLTELVGKYFKMIGGIAISPQFGNVTLDEKGAQDSFAHGIGRTKAIAFAAVKDVIEHGIVIDFYRNHKGRRYDTAVVIAPIEIAYERFLCSVVIKMNLKENRFYLHEVLSQKNLDDMRSNDGQNHPLYQQGYAKLIKEIITSN